MKPPITILATVLTMHERTGWQSKQLSEWIANTLYDQLGSVLTGKRLDYSLMVTYAHNFMPAASARNFAARQIKDVVPRPDWWLMIDNDMAPPPNLLDTVKDAPNDAAIIVPRFSMWDEGKAAVTLCWGMEDPKIVHSDERQFFTIDGPGFYPLSKCGTGAIFIKPEVFEKIEMPYFWYPKNADQGNEGTEDITFCKKVIDAGMKIYGNSSIAVGHYHNVNLEIVAQAIHAAEKQAVEIYKKSLDLERKLGNKEQVELTDDLRLDSVATARPVVVA